MNFAKIRAGFHKSVQCANRVLGGTDWKLLHESLFPLNIVLNGVDSVGVVASDMSVKLGKGEFFLGYGLDAFL